MRSIGSRLDPTNTYNPADAYQLSPGESAFPHVLDRVASLDPRMRREIVGVELYVKYAFAGIIGFIPFIASKVGEGIVKASVMTVKAVREITNEYRGSEIRIVETLFRMSIGILAATGGALLFVGSVTFSKAQALVWGQDLIEHPQEERVNTKLARYGAGDKPLEDYQKLLVAFFTPVTRHPYVEGSNGEFSYDFANSKVSNALVELEYFEAT